MNRIKVNGTFLESTSLIAQTFRVNNLGEISTRQGGSSNSFSFPLSSTNRQALGFPDDINETLRNPYKKVAAELYDGNVFLTKGNLKITEVTNTDIKATFFSDNVGWISTIKDQTLKDLRLNSLNHDWTGANIRASLSNTTGYIYPLVDYGEFKTATLASDIATTQMYPAVYVTNVFQQIFNQAGYQIEGEMLDLWEYNHMVIPFSAEDFVLSNDFITENTQTVLYLDQNVSSSGAGTVNITLTLDPSGTIYNATDSANYDVTITFSIANYSNLGTTCILNFNIGGSPTNGYDFTTPGNGTFSFTFNSTLLTTDNITLSIQLIKTVGANISFDMEDISMVLTPSGVMTEGNPVSIAANLPEIKQSDFVKYLFNLFGVIPVTDRVQNKITLNLFRNIKGRIGEADDWSDKIDVKNARTINFSEIVQDYANLSLFDYLDETDDFEIQTYKARNGIGFGSGILNIDNEHISNKEQIYEAPFAPMFNIVSFSDEIYVPQIRWLNSDGTKDVTPKPKIALIETGFSVNELTATQYTNISIDSVNVSTIPFMWFVKAPYTINTDVFTQSLSFGDVVFTANIEGMLTKYWQGYQDLLSNIKYVTADFKLSSADVSNLDFTKPVYIDFFKSYFYKNSVNEFTGNEQLTEAEIIKLL